MKNSQLKQLQELIKNSPSLIWYTKSYDNLDLSSIVTAIFNYGTWKQTMQLEQILGKKNLKKQFIQINSQKRTNLLPMVKNYFTHYLHV